MDIPYKLSLTLHRFELVTHGRHWTLDDLAMEITNCVLTEDAGWRCTHYGDDFTSNVFVARKLPYHALVVMAFSKDKTEVSYEKYFKSILGNDIELQGFTQVNRVGKFYTPFKRIALNKVEVALQDAPDGLFINRVKAKDVKGTKRKRPPKIPCYDEVCYDSDNSDVIQPPSSAAVGDDDGTEPTVCLDQQRFSALCVRPFPRESNFAIEIFSTGVLNVAGIPSTKYFKERILPYVCGPLVDILKGCEVKGDSCDTSGLAFDFDFDFDF